MAQAAYRWHSIAETFEQICCGQTPWVAIGNFLNDWWQYAVDHHAEMVEMALPSVSMPEMQCWAAFCAAMVEWLCQQEDVVFPRWTNQSCYVLSEPWFYYDDLESRSWLLATTPAPFKMRNIFGGDRMLLRKEHTG